MPLFMDVHNLGEVNADAVADAHEKDLEVQGKYGVNYHREAHGLVADEMYEVTEGS